MVVTCLLFCRSVRASMGFQIGIGDVGLALALVGIVSVLGSIPRPALAQSPEVRGTWLTTTGPDHISSGFNTEQIMGQLDDIGVNTVYVEAWKNGYTQFPSQTLSDLIGVDRSPSLGSRNLLEETNIAAHREGLIHMAWFEYGFSSQFIGNGGTPSNPLSQYMLSQTSTAGGQTVTGWLLEDRNGQYGNASNGFAWMNPAVPEVRRFLIDLTLEAIDRHDLDGVQFDDRLAWPREFGWDDTTAAFYKAQTGRHLPQGPNAEDDAHFRAWRQSQVTRFATELYEAVKAHRPDIHVSISPSITGFSDVNYNATWSDWAQAGLFDEFVPQVYRDNLAAFQSELPNNTAVMESAGRLEDLVVGIRYNGSGADTPQADVEQMIITSALARDGALAGHSLFYSKGLIENRADMAAFYGNERDHPFFGPDWRPEPIVAAPGDGGSWDVTVNEAALYRVVAEIAGRWSQPRESIYLVPGGYTFEVPGASSVELLLDRTPFAIPSPISLAVMAAGGVIMAGSGRSRRHREPGIINGQESR